MDILALRGHDVHGGLDDSALSLIQGGHSPLDIAIREGALQFSGLGISRRR